MIEVFRSIASWRAFRVSAEFGARSLGFVPTMGALHEGHLSLVKRSRSENDSTVVSIFVNPTQFNDPRDLERYPRTLERDLDLLREAGVDYVLSPEYGELYADGYRYRVGEAELSRDLCGAHRPGHFDGVLTVVMKLFQIVCARRAYFGEKDFQQYQLIRDMAEAFFLSTEVVGCPIVREADGLAMSSRNSLLGQEARARAPKFSYVLGDASSTAEEVASELAGLGFEVDYVSDRDTSGGRRRFGAVRIGGVRLIDNVEL